MNARIGESDVFRQALSKLLTGGLWVDDNQDGLKAEQAALYIAGVQAKALLMALEWNDGAANQGVEGWGHAHKWTERDTIAMVSWLTSFLLGARRVLPELRQQDAFCSSGDCYAEPEGVE